MFLFFGQILIEFIYYWSFTHTLTVSSFFHSCILRFELRATFILPFFQLFFDFTCVSKKKNIVLVKSKFIIEWVKTLSDILPNYLCKTIFESSSRKRKEAIKTYHRHSRIIGTHNTHRHLCRYQLIFIGYV